MSATTFVKSFTYLKGKPKSDQALPLLQRLASLVKPIMRKYNWSLPVLAEFFPRNDNLLDVNRGQKILIRLRPARSPDTFYDEEDLIGTMLHELTHNVHGPHDSKFYEFLSKLEQEYDDLKRSGYAGEGFFSEGKRVGAGVSHNVPMHAARQKALEAAEKRRRTAAILGGSGERLGGKSASSTKSLRQLAAEANQAAERRAQDEKTCGTTHQEDNEKEISRAAENSATEIIDVDKILTPSTSQIKKRPRSPSPASINHLSKRSLPKQSRLAGPSGIVKASLESDTWACRTCTLINEPLALQCSVCSSTRPQDLNPTWICLNCGEDGTEQQFWTCRQCGELRIEV
ncbi:hypothetical protein Clacol_002416 [Clathrus columnatus]|uniref:WLM-domain-containing protein n=1 Tax=Clathrus columnatus TaxID=1419009 RepID=A0AAV5A420_9AGAM|nr:hypothetical protein Clacol_002416 [Clathrus columnatus]